MINSIGLNKMKGTSLISMIYLKFEVMPYLKN